MPLDLIYQNNTYSLANDSMALCMHLMQPIILDLHANDWRLVDGYLTPITLVFN